MKKLVILIIIVAAIVGGVHLFKEWDKKAFTDYSRLRVEKMLYGIQSKKTALEQESIGYWHNGNPKTAVDEPMASSFDKFKQKKGIYRFSEYEVLSAELFNGEDQVNRYVEVKFKVDGKELGVIVRKKKIMEWLP